MLRLFQHICFPFNMGNLAALHKDRHFLSKVQELMLAVWVATHGLPLVAGVDRIFFPSVLTTFSVWHMSGRNSLPSPNESLGFPEPKPSPTSLQILCKYKHRRKHIAPT